MKISNWTPLLRQVQIQIWNWKQFLRQNKYNYQIKMHSSDSNTNTNTKYRIEMYSSGKSLLERNEELAARNRAVAEQCHQKLEVRVVICCALLVLCWCFVLFDCATKQLSVVVYDHKTAEFSGVKKSVDKRIDFGDASLRLIIGPIIVIIMK